MVDASTGDLLWMIGYNADDGAEDAEDHHQRQHGRTQMTADRMGGAVSNLLSNGEFMWFAFTHF